MKRTFFAFLLSIIMSASAYASVEKITLEGNSRSNGASAEATIEDSAQGGEQKELTLDANGLKPGSVYSVWLVNESLSFGKIGLSLKEFTSDSDGKGHLSAIIPISDLSDWDSIQVNYHPDGNPENLQSASVVLEGDIQQPEQSNP